MSSGVPIRILLLCLAVFSIQSGSFAASTKMRAGLDIAALPEPAKRPVKYFGDIHPILAEHCVGCHGAKKQKGGLRLDSLEAALAGGSTYGPAIVPGRSAESPLVLFVAHLEPEMEMPPEKPMLSQEAISVLRAWIDAGANWPSSGPMAASQPGVPLGNQEAIFKKAATHWSFQPVPNADPGSLLNGHEKVDACIASKLHPLGLQMSPRADGRTLLKRLHFDLSGLPPTPAQMETFLAAFAKDSNAALAATVDQLLAAPAFGERWGRYWLDLARYADTQDFFPQPDLQYPFAWTYRDYVIGAFNADKPHNQFIKEQLAADRLGFKDRDPTLAALGYLTVGPRFLKRQDEIINDRIDVVTRGLMGLTVACARCHDHKYDPVPTADFYALYGVFNSTEELPQLPEIDQPGAKPDPKARAEYDVAAAKVRKALTDFVQGLKEKAVADITSKPEIYFDALCEMEIKKTADVRKLISGKTMIETALTPLGAQWNSLKRGGKWVEDPVLGPLSQMASAAPERKAAVLQEVIDSGVLAKGKVAVDPVVLAAIRETSPKDEGGLLKVYGGLLAKAKDATDEPLKVVAKAFFGEGGWLDLPLKDVENAHRLLAEGRKDLEKLETAISSLESTHAGAPARAMALKDRAKPVSPVIFVRGDAARRGDPVDRRFLEILDPSKKAFPLENSGRLELAEKIVSLENPLTARVWANQVWRHLLGRPLVKTTGDFGLQAEPPTHPELLDWMASALMQRGWSTKKLIRDIVLSEVYLQRSNERPEASALDPDNALLWRANRRRMDFEAMRDAMLAISGQLDLTSGGRAVHLSAEPFSGRRTVYGFVDRVNLDPLFTTFDFPSPDIASTERSQTLVPQQALFALNDGFIVSQARALVASAQRATASVGQDPADNVGWLYQRVFQRPPTPVEARLGHDFLKETAGLREESSGGSWMYGVGSADPTVPREKAFQALPYFDPQAKRYQGGRVFPHPQFTFASITAAGGHPGANIANATIRRWIAPYSGSFDIGGEASVGKQGSGDGIRVRVISSKAGLLGEWIADHGTAKTELKSVSVTKGEILDFTVDCRENMNADGYGWVPTIHLVVKPEKAPKELQTVWDAQADFKAPPPPKLQPLEQMAHALLMTNEFLFID
jgi:mono/diheme cytochrome c family protein